MKLSVVESNERYVILADGNQLGFVPEEAGYPLGLELVVKQADKKAQMLNLVIGIEGTDASDYKFEVKIPEITSPSSEAPTVPPNPKIADILDKRRKGQVVGRKLSIVEQRRMSGPDKMKLVIEQRRKGK